MTAEEIQTESESLMSGLTAITDAMITGIKQSRDPIEAIDVGARQLRTSVRRWQHLQQFLKSGLAE